MMQRLLPLILIVTALVGSEPPAREPLTERCGPDAPLYKAFWAKKTPWNLSTLVEAYRQHGQRDERWDADAEALLGLWAHLFSGDTATMDNAELTALVTRLEGHADCKDGLVRYCLGKSYERLGQKKKLKPAWRQAAAALADSKHPSLRKAFSVQRLLELEDRRRKGLTEKAQAHITTWATHIDAALKNGEYKDHERIFLEHVCQEVYRDKAIKAAWLQAFDAALTDGGHLGTWYGETAAGWIDVKLAWVARGSGWASSVTEEGWKGFEKHLTAAKGHFNKAWLLDDSQPMAAVQMIQVAMGGHADLSERQWFDRATRAEFDFIEAYNKLLWAIRPRWGGSYQKMLAFGHECAATERYDTYVPGKLLDAIIDMQKEADRFERPQVMTELFGDERNWVAADKVVSGFIAHPSKAHKIDWYRSQRVGLAWRFGKQETALTEAKDLGNKLNERALKLYKVELATIVKALESDDDVVGF